MSKSRKGGESAGHKDLNPKEASGGEVAWLGLHTKRAFLEQRERCFFIDPSSAEGFNSHLALYYYFSEDWSIPHPTQVRTCVMKRDSTQPLGWVGCVTILWVVTGLNAWDSKPVLFSKSIGGKPMLLNPTGTFVVRVTL